VRLALFDYGAGNLHSLQKALGSAGASVRITSDWEEALALDALVLPGVGAFGQATTALPEDREALVRSLREGLPCLGICLGMQLFFEGSDEADGSGLGLIPGRVRLLDAPIVPHMGWNDVNTSPDPIFDGLSEPIVYFANSYVCEPTDTSCIIARSTYAGRTFASGVRASNCWGVQFHPEKSSAAGRRIVANFVEEARVIIRSRAPAPEGSHDRPPGEGAA
jgi:glutamine amidotransferase